MTDKVVAQADLFGNPKAVAVEGPVTSRGTPIEPAIAKRYPRTLCVCCQKPFDWFPKSGKPEYVDELRTWCCGGCLKLHDGVNGVVAYLERIT